MMRGSDLIVNHSLRGLLVGPLAHGRSGRYHESFFFPDLCPWAN